MNYKVKCLVCGATWWCKGDYEPDTNATNLDDSEVHEGQCQCGGEEEIIDSEPIEFEANYL